MTAQPVMGLREFTKAREDSRLLLLDSRLPEERETQPLANPFFSVAYSPRATILHDAIHIAMIVGDRHVVVVDIDEADAARVAQTLREAGVAARPLERGLSGWQDALVEECVERRDDVEVVTLVRVSNGRRSYILIDEGEAVVVNAAGCGESFACELEEHHAKLIGTFDTAPDSLRRYVS